MRKTTYAYKGLFVFAAGLRDDLKHVRLLIQLDQLGFGVRREARRRKARGRTTGRLVRVAYRDVSTGRGGGGLTANPFLVSCVAALLAQLAQQRLCAASRGGIHLVFLRHWYK